MVISWLSGVMALAASFGRVQGAELPADVHFRTEVQPLLQQYCYDCHGDGARKGQVAFDELETKGTLLESSLWMKVLKNIRAGLMPPQKRPRPTPEELEKIQHWIKYDVFGIDPLNPDPGRVTVRRLNRVEYRNTIKDLMGIDYHTEVEFPPDDTGYGFDNIGDVLTVSPMLLEKYLAAAETIVAETVPTIDRILPERTIPGNRFRPLEAVQSQGDGGASKKMGPLSLSFYEPANVVKDFRIEHAGDYRLALEMAVKGNFEFDPGKCRVVFRVDGQELLSTEFGWHNFKTFPFEFDQQWAAGDHRLALSLEPLTPTNQKINSLELHLQQATVSGPKAKEYWVRPKNYERFFKREVPADNAARRLYAREILGNFARKAFRRPVEDKTIERLVTLAEGVYTQPGMTFEAGVGHAMTAVLASPRFLFRLESAETASSVKTDDNQSVQSNANREKANPTAPLSPESIEKSPASSFANVDEFSLASRLSYFLWSTMPDDELFRLARRHELRKNLDTQVKRMLADSRSERLFQNFTGQWLQTRDVDFIPIDAETVLARDSGHKRKTHRQRAEFRAQLAKRNGQSDPTNSIATKITNSLNQIHSADPTNAVALHPDAEKRRMPEPAFELDYDLRESMRRETEMYFANLAHEDRPVTELIDSDYTFLNEKLAKLYGLTNLNITGHQMRRVTLPAGCPRGGVLTQGSTLVVTSNPDRTSPVKRGLFILENFLGTPPPPPPPNIPALEAAEKGFKDHEPTLRETLQAHRENSLCASCHSRMDPIGLGMENFNALGMWREQERNQDLDTTGTLTTGESFTNVFELKHILAENHRTDFYRCLTEKLLTYAVGRGTEHYDQETIDQIVQRLERENGRFSALLFGIIESAPFQKMRIQATSLASTDRASFSKNNPQSPTRAKETHE